MSVQSQLVVRSGGLCVVGGLLLLVRMSVMGGAPPSFSSSDNPAASENSTLTRVLTFSHLPSMNMLLLLCPRWLSFDWSMSSIPLVESLGDERNLGTAVFYILLTVFIVQMAQTTSGRV